jgi:uncharacterized protein YgiM (DUF1202 family)
MRTVLLTIMFFAVASQANAAIPFLNATCPLDMEVHADQGGPVFINGEEAALQTFNENYYEATLGGVTVSISINPDGSPSVSYSALGGADGICQVAANNAGADTDYADGMAGGPDYWTVTDVPANDVLNVRAGPGTGEAIIGALANGDVVRNLGCRMVGSSRWCQIEMAGDQPFTGWVNGRYLRE